MAHGKAPGTHTTNGITSTLKSPWNQAASQREGVGGGMYDHGKGPFDKPRSSGGIPVKMYDGLAPGKATVKQPGGVVTNSSLGTIKTSRGGSSSM